MSGFREVGFDQESFSLDAAARLRVGQLTGLGDLKTIGADDSLLLENTGTGTGTWGNNKYDMSVTSGQFRIRRSKVYFPYLSGKSTIVECSFDNFQPQANVVKRVGYFSSNTASPYNSTLDGFWLESDGTTIRLIASRSGTETLNVAWTSWTNYNQISSYNWSNFTVVVFDMVWLGGAQLRLFLKTDLGFVLAHVFHYSGSATDTFIGNPSHSVRYEIRSSTGTGSFRYICSQVSTEGTRLNVGKEYAITAPSAGVTTATNGTTYPLKAIRKSATYRHRYVEVVDFNTFVNSADQMLVTLQINPTLSAGLTYSAVSNTGIEAANGNGTITVTTPGTVVYAQTITQNAVMPTQFLSNNFLSGVGMSIADVSDQMVLCGTNLSAGITSFTNIRVREL